MFIQPKKINTGLDRIFIIVSVLSMYLGFFIGGSIYKEIKRSTVHFVVPSFPKINGLSKIDEILLKYGGGDANGAYFEQFKTRIEKKEWDAWLKKKDEAFKQAEKYKKELEGKGYNVSYGGYGYFYIYPPSFHVKVASIISTVASFFIVLFSLRGLTLLILWVHNGFKESKG